MENTHFHDQLRSASNAISKAKTVYELLNAKKFDLSIDVIAELEVDIRILKSKILELANPSGSNLYA